MKDVERNLEVALVGRRLEDNDDLGLPGIRHRRAERRRGAQRTLWLVRSPHFV
jgi:hypothetical protein